jgi:hypothetical protein
MTAPVIMSDAQKTMQFVMPSQYVQFFFFRVFSPFFLCDWPPTKSGITGRYHFCLSPTHEVMPSQYVPLSSCFLMAL